MKAQNDKKHWESKLAEEEDKVKKVEDAVKVLQEEFTVSLLDTALDLDGVDGSCVLE